MYICHELRRESHRDDLIRTIVGVAKEHVRPSLVLNGSEAIEIPCQALSRSKSAIVSYILHMWIPRDVEARLKRSAVAADEERPRAGTQNQARRVPLRDFSRRGTRTEA